VQIYVDADGCPVKPEIYRVAQRYALRVHVVANACIHLPEDSTIAMVVVGEGADAADDWIADHVAHDDVVVTADIPLAARCLARGAAVLHPKGRPFKEDDIGDALASRAIGEHLRASGVITGGPAPFQQRDRSQFLQALDAAIQKAKRRRRD
jgi:uncharacterized protein YaiI (UPF0178 family)